MRNVETLLFDLDGTLVRYRESPGEVLTAAFDALNRDPMFTIEDYRNRFDEFIARTDSMSELRRECFASLASDYEYGEQAGYEVAEEFEKQRDHSEVECLDGVHETIRKLKADVSLCTVTNGAEDAQRTKLEAASLADHMDAVVVADGNPEPKPSAEPFEEAMRRLDTRPANTAHVGNSLSSDVRGANRAGITSILINSEGRPSGSSPPSEPDHVITSFSELIEVLD